MWLRHTDVVVYNKFRKLSAPSGLFRVRFQCFASCCWFLSGQIFINICRRWSRQKHQRRLLCISTQQYMHLSFVHWFIHSLVFHSCVLWHGHYCKPRCQKGKKKIAKNFDGSGMRCLHTTDSSSRQPPFHEVLINLIRCFYCLCNGRNSLSVITFWRIANMPKSARENLQRTASSKPLLESRFHLIIFLTTPTSFESLRNILFDVQTEIRCVSFVRKQPTNPTKQVSPALHQRAEFNYFS